MMVAVLSASALRIIPGPPSRPGRVHAPTPKREADKWRAKKRTHDVLSTIRARERCLESTEGVAYGRVAGPPESASDQHRRPCHSRTETPMINRTLATLLLASSVLCASLPARGEFTPEEWRSLKSQVMGTIRDVSGLPLAKAKVSGTGTEWSSDGRSGQQKTFETYTDSLGSYRLELPAGADLAWVQHPDSRRIPGAELLIRGPITPGEHRADFRFQLFNVHGKLLGADSLPAPQGLVLYYATPPKGSMMCGTGLP